ncbi:hypothetical protein SKAU_G00140410 [Synaphobranchus kaupii]|uniref:Vesicle transport v-SNARE N-terminal domain-containing protein n=1 Tax=Synaphobranchus kaupii TaxID=118154 RepID=A0A9Q1J4D1_SYNKA|nr:hypothetical protein SKAU_G00140410 [Synaphobranchus kaupii]
MLLKTFTQLPFDFTWEEEKTQQVLNVDKQLEEVRELLEQMDLEVREIPIQSRGMYSSRLKSYKQEVEKLEKDFKRSRIAYSDEVRNDLLGEGESSSESQLIKLREERAHPVGQHREAGKVISETGGRLPDRRGNRYARAGSREQIVSPSNHAAASPDGG